jgi:hypothetical protein
MLQEIMENIHNYFIHDRLSGQFEISDGMIHPLPALIDGQKILIDKSAMNNGVYTYHPEGIMNDDDTSAAGFTDETWAGTICALAVPPAVIALSGEIKQWVEKNGEIVNSPYNSESVLGVYNYTKASGGTGAGGAVTWQDVYGSRLNRWRKVAF